MGFNCGIVGLPNVGKSTIFNAMTAAGAEASNYPFCTINPNIGMVPLRDERLAKLTELANPERTLPTAVEFVDIAGIVKGASKGEGLGNQFLGNIRSVDMIAHVVRCFEDEQVVHVAGKTDPLIILFWVNVVDSLRLETFDPTVTEQPIVIPVKCDMFSPAFPGAAYLDRILGEWAG